MKQSKHHKWTDAEREYLLANHASKTIKEIAMHLGLNPTAVGNMAYYLHVPSKFFKYTEDVDRTITEMYPTHTAGEIACLLETSKWRIQSRVRYLKLRKMR